MPAATSMKKQNGQRATKNTMPAPPVITAKKMEMIPPMAMQGMQINEQMEPITSSVMPGPSSDGLLQDDDSLSRAKWFSSNCTEGYSASRSFPLPPPTATAAESSATAVISEAVKMGASIIAARSAATAAKRSSDVERTISVRFNFFFYRLPNIFFTTDQFELGRLKDFAILRMDLPKIIFISNIFMHNIYIYIYNICDIFLRISSVCSFNYVPSFIYLFVVSPTFFAMERRFEIRYSGRRVVVRAAPGRSLREVLDDARGQLGLAPSAAGGSLRYMGRPLDLSLPVRLANLPATASLELVPSSAPSSTQPSSSASPSSSTPTSTSTTSACSSSSPSAAAATIRVAVALPDGARFTSNTVPASACLWEVLRRVEQDAGGGRRFLDARLPPHEGGHYLMPRTLVLARRIETVEDYATLSPALLGITGSLLLRLEFVPVKGVSPEDLDALIARAAESAEPA